MHLTKILHPLFFLFALLAVSPLQGQNSGKVYGKVLDTNDIPLQSVHIYIKGNPAVGSLSNEAGRFELSIEADKELLLVVSSLGYIPQEIPVKVSPEKRLQLTVVMHPSNTQLPEFSVSERYTPNTGVEYINPKPVAHLPSINSSIEGLIKSAGLGVTSHNELSSQYNVRGGNYDENLIYLNGIEVYRPFLIRSGQQEGLSFINPDMVSAVRFSSGGFDASYGDKMSSVLDVKYKTPIAFGGSVYASLLGGGAHLEGASKNQKFSYLAGLRYHSNAYLIRKLQTKGHYNPNFTDLQLLLNYKANARWSFRLFGNYARNSYHLIPVSSEQTYGTINSTKRLRVYFDGQEVDAYQTVFASLQSTFSPDEANNFRFNLAFFNSTEKETFDIEGQYFISEVNNDFGSEELGQDISPRAVGSDLHHGRNFLLANLFHGEVQATHLLKSNTLTWGIKAQGEFIDDQLNEWRLHDSTYYTLPFIPTTPGDSVDLDNPARDLLINDYLYSDNYIQSFRLSGFVQDSWHFGDSVHRFTLSGGLRFSYWTFNRELIATPRLRLSYQPDIKADISFYTAIGMYYQPPFYKEMRRPDGSINTDIQSQKSYHLILGTDYLFKIARFPFKLSGEVYYKYLDDLITYTVDNVRIIYSGENDAVGYAVGIDAKLSGEIVPGLESWLAFSLMKSMEDIKGDYFTVFLDSNHQPTFDPAARASDTTIYPGYIPRLTDQRFTVNLFFQDKVPKLPMLKAHINLIYSTPLIYSIPGYSRGQFAFRGNAYFRADLGLSWQFINDASFANPNNPLRVFKAAFLSFEIFNVFNYYNTISYTFVKDISGETHRVPNYLTPRIYNAKLRVEF